MNLKIPLLLLTVAIQNLTASSYHISEEMIKEAETSNSSIILTGKMTTIKDVAYFLEGEIVATTKEEFRKKFPKQNVVNVLRVGSIKVDQILTPELKKPKVVSVVWKEPLAVGGNGAITTCPAVTYSGQSGEKRIWYLTQDSLHNKIYYSYDVAINNQKEIEKTLNSSETKNGEKSSTKDPFDN